MPRPSIAIWITVPSDALACRRIGGRIGPVEQRAHDLVRRGLARKGDDRKFRQIMHRQPLLA